MIARMKVLVALAALTTILDAAVAEPSQDQQRKTTLVVDFCGAVVAQDKVDFEVVARRIPGLTLGPAKPLSELAADPAHRQMFRGLLKAQDADSLHFAGFGPEPPSLKNRPFVALRADGGSCMVVGEPAAVTVGPLRTQLASANSTWKEDETDANSELWTRNVAGFAQAMTISRDESLMVISQAPSPDALAARVASATTAALRPCLEGMLTGQPPDPGLFSPPFVGESKKPSDTKPGLVSTLFSMVEPGLRAAVTVHEFENEIACEFWAIEAPGSIEPALGSVIDSIGKLTSGNDFRISTLPVRPPVFIAWRISRASGPRAVNISVATPRGRAIAVRLEPIEGWDW
jgi:hypothetical protein